MSWWVDKLEPVMADREGNIVSNAGNLNIPEARELATTKGAGHRGSIFVNRWIDGWHWILHSLGYNFAAKRCGGCWRSHRNHNWSSRRWQGWRRQSQKKASWQAAEGWMQWGRVWGKTPAIVRSRKVCSPREPAKWWTEKTPTSPTTARKEPKQCNWKIMK